MSYPSLQLNQIRVLALSRLFLALSMFLLVVTDPGALGYQIEPDDLIGTAYLLVALVWLAIAWSDWWLNFKVMEWSQHADFLAFVLLPSTIEPFGSGYRVAALAIGAFQMLETRMRWDWRRAAVSAVAINLANITIVAFEPVRLLLHPESAGAGMMDPSLKIRNIFMLLAVSMVILWFSRGFVQSPRRLVIAEDRVGGVDPPARLLLEAVMAAFGAQGGVLCWSRRAAGQCEATRAGVLDSGPEPDGERPEWGAPSCFTALQPLALVFDLARGHAVELTDGGSWRAIQLDKLDEAMFDALAPCAGVSVPLVGVTGSGRLIVTGLRALDIFHAARLTSLAETVAAELDRADFELTARQAAELDLRTTLAHELHDGVAQSLAGACFWLASLRRKADANPALAAEVDKVRRALEGESSHVREVISMLRNEPESIRTIDLGASIDAFLPRASSTWGLRTAFAADGAPVTASPALVFELQQILREAMSNAVRHGAATRVEVRLAYEGDVLRIEIEDNGRGFAGRPPHPLPKVISERAKKLQGSVDIVSTEGQTRVTITLPLEEDA